MLLDRADAAGDTTCPVTRTCSERSRCCSPTTCWPTAGRSAATSIGCGATIDRIDVSPLGAGALAGSSLPLDPELHRRPARLRDRVRELARRRVATATTSPRRCSI